jgi:hypothetical protein
VGSTFDDWIYQHFFIITFNYNSSHIQLLVNDVWLTKSPGGIPHCCLVLGLISSLSNFGSLDLSSESESYVTTDDQ